uniref:Transmembrane protein 214 n=1 Tax=Callorhinchus milii TaxID=7868 RepID=A0A4W3H353_CALMI
MGKKQNKEQVPPTSGPQQHQHKAASGGKLLKKPGAAGGGGVGGGDAGQKPRTFPSLEAAVKAVCISKVYSCPESNHLVSLASVQLDLKELQEQLDKSQNLFPGNPSVWVKDLASYLNYKLQAPETDPTLSQYSYDYPYNLAGKELRNIIKSLLTKAGDTLEHFFDHCIYTMLREQDKTSGESLHGFRICIQAILLDTPKIGTMNLGKHMELLRSHQNRPVKCLTIMWALGQAGTDLSEGLKVWLGIMLPVLGIKSLSSYAISYLDKLLMMHSNLIKGFGIIGPKDFFPLLDFAFMPNNSLSPNLQDQLRHLYPRLKVLAFGAKPESTLHTYFPSFLSRATPNCPADMKKELLQCMVECLNKDSHSFSVWRQLYTKHLAQSSLLLNNLLETWANTPAKVQKALQETVRSFKVTNEELSAKGANNVEEIAACNTACNFLLQKLKGGGFPWSRLLFVLVVFVAGFVIQDIRIHGSFNGYLCCHLLLLNYHLLWMETNTPHYYSEAITKVRPNLELVGGKLIELAVYTRDKLSNQIIWINENVPKLIEWVSCSQFASRKYVSSIVQYGVLNLASSFNLSWLVSDMGEISWDCVKNHFINSSHFTWSYVQNTTIAVKNWASSMISNH